MSFSVLLAYGSCLYEGASICGLIAHLKLTKSQSDIQDMHADFRSKAPPVFKVTTFRVSLMQTHHQ